MGAGSRSVLCNLMNNDTPAVWLPVIMSCPPLLSATWFPLEERCDEAR
jgi:hypothetical protein